MKVRVKKLRDKDIKILERDPCPEGYTCIKDSYKEISSTPVPGSDTESEVIYEIQIVPEYWKSETVWEGIRLPAKYLIESWWFSGPSGGHTDNLSQEISIPVRIQALISGGGPFLYGDLMGVNAGTWRYKQFAGILWEVNAYNIRLSDPKKRNSSSISIHFPPVPQEIDVVDMDGITLSQPVPLSKRLFDARRELLHRVTGDKKRFSEECSFIEAEVKEKYQAEEALYQQEFDAYNALRAEQESLRDQRIARWKKEENLIEIPELVRFIEAEIKGRYEKR